MSRILVSPGPLILLATLACSIAVPAQPISASMGILSAEPREISKALPLIHAFERRHEDGPEQQKQLLTWKQSEEQATRLREERRQIREEERRLEQEQRRARRQERARREQTRIMVEKLRAEQDILQTSSSHSFDVWDASNNEVIAALKSLIPLVRGPEQEWCKQSLMYQQEESLVQHLLHLVMLSGSNGGGQGSFLRIPEDRERAAEQTIPVALERWHTLVNAQLPEAYTGVPVDINVQIRDLQGLRGTLTHYNEQTTDTIRRFTLTVLLVVDANRAHRISRWQGT
jgi:hypothetical protein